MVTNVYAKFPYGLLRIKKALGTFEKGNNNPNNNNCRSALGPFRVQKLISKHNANNPDTN